MIWGSVGYHFEMSEFSVYIYYLGQVVIKRVIKHASHHEKYRGNFMGVSSSSVCVCVFVAVWLCVTGVPVCLSVCRVCAVLCVCLYVICVCLSAVEMDVL